MKLMTKDGAEISAIPTLLPSESGDLLDFWIRPGMGVKAKDCLEIHHDDGTVTDIEIIRVIPGNDGLTGPKDRYGRPPKSELTHVVADVLGTFAKKPPRGSPVPQ